MLDRFRVNGTKYFTEMDLASGYHQLRIKEEDIPQRQRFAPVMAAMNSL
jgi:hypothetical protein